MQRYVQLNNGLKMPAIGLGTVGAMKESDVIQMIDNALEVGYRHIDTAYIYHNEAFIGKALKKWLDSGKLKREDLFVTTKLPKHGVHPDRAQNFLDDQLKALQLDYVDLYLIHYPVGFIGDSFENSQMEGKTDHVAIWKKMEELVDQGKTRSIGVSNYTVSQIDLILKNCRIKPASTQEELHLLRQKPELLEFCKKNGISVVAYSPLGNPLFRPAMKAMNPTKAEQFQDTPKLLENPVVLKIAKSHAKTAAQVLIRFVIQLGAVPIPKSSNPQRLRENLDVFDFLLDDKQMKELKSLDKGLKICDWSPLAPGIEKHPDFPM